jgi:pyruvate,water dikinase
LKILSFFKRKKPPPPPGGEDFLQHKYQSFKNLLDANNAALQVMSRLEEKLAGDFVFDMQYLRAGGDKIFRACETIIAELNALGDARYAELGPVYAGLKTRIQDEILAGTAGDQIPLVLPLSQVDRRLLMAVGGKNANLGEIKNRLNLPTPDGFVLTTAAYRLVLAENQLTHRLARLLETVDMSDVARLTDQSQRLRELVLAAPIPAPLAEAVQQQYLQLTARLGYEPQLALRSSGLYEDQELSFAGQFLTVLNVPLADFFPNYLKVLASQFAPTALMYLGQKGLLHYELAMSVGCLAMVPARASGVLFTVDPTGEGDEVMVIEAAWGLGPSVVEGTVTPDRYSLAKKPETKIVRQHLGSKPVRLTAAAGQVGLTQEAVPAGDQGQPALTEAELLQLGRYGVQLEEYFRGPQDIEFAVDLAGRLLLLQCRPLTLPQPEAAAGLPPDLQARHPVLLEHGTAACFGVAAGPVFIIHQDEDLARFPEGAVLVARHTSSRYGLVLHKASALVADIGSATSHLAILAREFNLPALVDTEHATQVLPQGQEVTVDANHLRVYQGRVEALIAAKPEKPALLAETPIYATLRRVLRWITPLNLTDPKLQDFTPASCKTIHDLTRFAHQMAVAEMFDLGERVGPDQVHLVQLKTPIPLNLHLIDLGGGLAAPRRARFVPPEAITSIPLKALWRGISHPEISWAGPIPIDMRGLYSVVSRSLTGAPPDFWARTLAIVSQNYLNYNSRLGYHFATLDAFVSDVRNDNYISFRFKGGAADEPRRGRRARFLGTILAKLDFEVEVTGDLVVAKLWKYPRPLMEEKLDLVGRLMGCARQRDMVMADDALVDWYIEAFLAGNYRFAGEPGAAPAS